MTMPPAWIKELGLFTTASAVVISNDAPAVMKAVARVAKVALGNRIQICDGVNDQVEIQAALDAVSAGGGKVVLLDGTYLVDHQPDATYSVIALRSNTWLCGCGPNTIIKLADNAVLSGQTGHPIIETYDEVALTTATNWKASDFQIDGNKNNQTADTQTSMNIGIWVRRVTEVAGHKRCCLDNIKVHDTISAGFYFEEIVANRMTPQNVFGNNLTADACFKTGTLTTVGNFHFDSVSGVFLDNVLSINGRFGARFVDASRNVVRLQTSNNAFGVSIERSSYESIKNRIDIFSYLDTAYAVYADGGSGQYKTYENHITGRAYGTWTGAGVWGRYLYRYRFEMKLESDGTGQATYIRDSEECVFDFDTYNSAATGGSFSTNCLHNIIKGSYVFSKEVGLSIGGNYNTIIAPICKDNSQTANNAYAELRCDGQYNTFVGPICRSTQAKKAKYSYQEYSGDYNKVEGGVFQGAVTKAIGYPGETNVLGAHTRAYEQHSDLLMDVLAVSATHVRSNEDLSAAIPITFTIAQPDVPRTLSGHFDAHGNITAYSITITGVDARGNTVAETKTEADGWDWETNNAFATITSIIMTARTGTGAGDTMDIGITDVLGLSNKIYSTSDVYKIKKNNANAVVAVAQVNTTYCTYDMAAIGLVDGDDFTIYFRSNLNIVV